MGAEAVCEPSSSGNLSKDAHSGYAHGSGGRSDLVGDVRVRRKLATEVPNEKTGHLSPVSTNGTDLML